MKTLKFQETNYIETFDVVIEDYPMHMPDGKKYKCRLSDCYNLVEKGNNYVFSFRRKNRVTVPKDKATISNRKCYRIFEKGNLYDYHLHKGNTLAITTVTGLDELYPPKTVGELLSEGWVENTVITW